MIALPRVRLQLSLRWMLLLIGVIAIALGLLSQRIRRQQESIHRLRQLGGQLKSPAVDPYTWATGVSVENVQFLGPQVGDEAVAEIGEASAMLRVKRITLMETSVSQRGLEQLRLHLPEVKIQMVTPQFGIPQTVR